MMPSYDMPLATRRRCRVVSLAGIQIARGKMEPGTVSHPTGSWLAPGRPFCMHCLATNPLNFYIGRDRHDISSSYRSDWLFKVSHVTPWVNTSASGFSCCHHRRQRVATTAGMTHAVCPSLHIEMRNLYLRVTIHTFLSRHSGAGPLFPNRACISENRGACDGKTRPDEPR